MLFILLLRFYNVNGDPIGPERVYLKNKPTPGLAMTRSFGDKYAHSVGVINTPGTSSQLIYRNYRT